MSLSKFESEVKHLPQAQEAIYARFADLRNLESLKQRINDPALEEKLSSQVPADKLADEPKQT